MTATGTTAQARPKAKRGRPAKHADDLERNRAWREQQAANATLGEMYSKIFANPTPQLMRSLGRKAMEAAIAKDGDPAGVAVELVAALLNGIDDGAGQNAWQAALNQVVEFRLHRK